MTTDLRATHIGSLYVGPYVDKPGAVMSIGDQVVHLSQQQCLQLAQRLAGCAHGTAATDTSRTPA